MSGRPAAPDPGLDSRGDVRSREDILSTPAAQVTTRSSSGGGGGTRRTTDARVPRFATLRSFQSRIIVSFLILITLVQVGSLIAVDSAIERSARGHVKAQLGTASKVFARLIDVRNRRLVEAARILSGDFPFKQVVAINDHGTLLSAMNNHRRRIGADLMMVVALDGTPLADTLHPNGRADGRPPFVGLPRLIGAAEQTGEVADFVVIDGRPYQVVVVPLLAPEPTAWICMGFLVDRDLAEELQKTTSSHVSFVHVEPGNVWLSFTSTLPPPARRLLLDTLSRRAAPTDAPGAFDLPGTGFETLVLPLPSSSGSPISVTLQRPLADAMEPYRFLRTALLVLFGTGASISIIGGVWIARGVSRPVRQLADAARRIEAGEYGGAVVTSRQDELGDLAATFNRMTSAVAEREERLRESEERFRAMTESAVDAVVTADGKGDIVSWNRGAQTIFGYAPEEVLGTSLARLVPERYRDVERGGLERFESTGASVELHGLMKDGREFPVELSLATWETRQGRFRTAIIRDITERKQLEDQFRQAQKMESVGRLAGGVAHDFNNLLTVIGGQADLLQAGLRPEDPLHRRVASIQKAAGHAADLTRQLLAFSRKQVLAPKVLDLNAVLAGIEPMLQRLIGEDIDLITLPARGLGRVKADPAQITQIVLNLVVNARDAMPDGGKLTIETRDAELDEFHAHRQPDTPSGPYVMLAVSDTGVGMDAETRARIFEPFFTTKGPGKGTGLGLATVYGIVKQSNGNIAVYSEPGRGTTFQICLPRVEEAGEPGGGDLLPAEPRGSETILLVEDNEMVRDLTAELLEAHGYTVLEARTGAAALDISRRHRGPIHVLLTDVIMPEMGGCELASRLGSERPDTAVLYMSGYTAEAVVRQGVLDERVAFLSKPVREDVLVRKVREVLDARRGRAAATDRVD
ncbi:MAG: PAS domain S-box protein [Candidatus Rokuibacteriota bacterium]